MIAHKPAGLAAMAVALAVVLASGASASPPVHRQLGTKFKVLAGGQTVTVEVRLKPLATFASVRVEPGSGVGSLSPPCSFSDVVRGGSYVCQVNVTHAPGHASLTLNVVGEKQLQAGKPREFEVSHFTIPNADYVAPARNKTRKPTPGLAVLPAQRTPEHP